MKFPSVYYTSVLALLAVHATGAVTSYNDSPTSSDVITTSYTPPQPSSSYGASPTTPGYPVTSGYPGPVQVLWGQCWLFSFSTVVLSIPD